MRRVQSASADLAGPSSKKGSFVAVRPLLLAAVFASLLISLPAFASTHAARAAMVARTVRVLDERNIQTVEELTRRNAELAVALQRRAQQQHRLWIALFASLTLLSGAAFVLIRLRAANASLEQRALARTSELRQQTLYLRALVNTIPLGAWLKDTKGRYLIANRQIAQVCNHPVEEMIGRTDDELWPREIVDAHREEDAQVMATRKLASAELLAHGPKGSRWIQYFKAPVMDEDGSLLGMVVVTHDITARKAVETAREAALDEAEKLARLRSEFVAQMSHELRTPLNGILGYAAVLLRDSTLNERQRAAAKVVQQSGEHLLRLIDDVLDLAKIEAGKLELRPSEIALGPFLHSIDSIVTLRAQAKQLAFALELAADLPDGIHADEQRLRQILLNLLSNAIQYTDRGRVCLQVRALSAHRLRFEVRDTGIGIDHQHLEEIFQPFGQVADARHRVGGTGLGLAISRRYVRLMASDIQVESTFGAGSVFRFDLEVPFITIETTKSWQPRQTSTHSNDTSEPLAPPPLAELTDLHHLALQGNMRDIVGWTRRIIELDESRYRAFANHIRQLAENYESQAILTLVQQLVRKDGA